MNASKIGPTRTGSHECHDIEELSNGILLFEVLAEIDPVWFKLIRTADLGENWVLKIANLKKMYRMIARYYDDILGVPFEKMPQVDLTAIAKDANRQEIFKLCQLVLFITVQRENNAAVVERLQSLSEQTQRVFMLYIEEINHIRSATTGHGASTASPLVAGTTDYTPRSSFADDAAYRTNQNDLARLNMEKEELETAHRKLIEEHAQLRFKYDELENEKGDLQLRLQEMDKAVTRANETGISDIIMRTELAHLKKDLLEEQNHGMMERNQQIENEYRKVLAFKTLMDSYKDQVTMLETKNNELIREKNKMEYEMQQLSKKIDLLEVDRARDTDRIHTLEDSLQEAQLDDMDVDEDDEDDVELEGSLEESLKETNVTELKRSKRRLERELRTLQEKGGSDGEKSDKAMVLQHLLEDANRLKEQFEKNYLEVSQERDILQSDMARVRQGISDALLDDSQNTMALRLRILDLEKEGKQLRAEVAELQDRIDHATHAPSANNATATASSFSQAAIDQLQGGADIDAFKAQFKDMVDHSASLERQVQKQLQDINKLLVEKDRLHRQNEDQKEILLEKEHLYSEMKASLAVFEAKDDDTVKQHYATLQQQSIQQHEQLQELKLKLNKYREFIKQQDQMLKSNATNNTGNYDEAVTSLKSEVSLRDEEIERLKKQLFESRLQARREQQLMMSAWFDLSRHGRRDLVGGRPYPTSWLAHQRTKH
ncbi:hypothetical protein BC940DRAFT_325455 [Gongronella butleri]|nr:hypothetical protein BC940DRAFT_325455 [Gongronella butleri]